MNLFKATLDTRHQNGVIGTITQFDNATLELQILSGGQVDEAWQEPQFELIAIKRDMNQVREVEQDKFTILSKEDHRVQIDLKEQFLTYKGSVKAQLVIKDGSRLSTTIFYLSIGQSLDSTIVESHRDVKVLDDLEAYVEKANHNLEIYEQRMDIRDEQFNNLNDSMNQAEAKRDQAELNRQQIFDVNEASRTRTFNNQMNNQETSFNDVQIERVNEFERDQTKRADDFVQAQNNREQAFNESQSANQSTFNSNEKKRQDEFNANQAANQKIFNDSESARTRTFEVAESERCENEKTRKEDESKRVSDEVKRVEAENKRQQKMQEFEDIANQIASDLQEQVTRVDEFVTANELKLLEEDARIDYMGNNQKSIRKVNEANVDYAVKTAIGEFNYLDYEGQHITANNSIEGHTKSAILKGQTLVNLCPSKVIDYVASSDWDGYHQLVQNSKQSFDQWRALQDLKPNTKYYISCYVETFEVVNNEGYCLNNPSVESIFGDSMIVNGVGRYQWLSTTKSELTDEIFMALRCQNALARGAIKIRDFMIIEYQEGMENWDIPYFTGMSSVRMPVLQTTGKNLFDMNRPYDAITDSQATVVQDTNQITVSSANSGTYVSANFILDKDFFAGKTVTGSCLYESDIKDIGTVQINYQDDNGDHHYQWIKTPKTFTFPNNFIGDVMLCVSANNTGTPQSNTVTVKNIQLELGSSVTPYYEPHKSNILTVNEDVELGSVGEVKDELDLLTGKITQRTDIRPYQESDESDSEVLTDMTNTRYKLAQEVVKTVVLNDNTVYSYDGVTHYSCSSEEGSLVPTVSLKVPTDVQATITQQRNTIQALESENEALKYGLIEANQYREDGDMDLLSNQWDIDFRLFEIEMVLDVPMAVAYKIVKENDSMSRYLQAKTLILGGRYERSKMEYQLKRYLEAGQLTQEEYDELISLMDAREMLA
ncbi:hypothetical protein [Turicibacter sanguinis]|uniref:hypothetical protein n=1 Tax=Turicibacter sanguinis TaxID=154288 RepID=UPI0021D50BC1|nr:hypothetical protein [Turicibacter sanguinis]MCU7190638.1 hypothetical protein [Turicibacter sanguinis]